jgi:hypothetical protein
MPIVPKKKKTLEFYNCRCHFYFQCSVTSSEIINWIPGRQGLLVQYGFTFVGAPLPLFASPKESSLESPWPVDYGRTDSAAVPDRASVAAVRRRHPRGVAASQRRRVRDLAARRGGADLVPGLLPGREASVPAVGFTSICGRNIRILHTCRLPIDLQKKH